MKKKILSMILSISMLCCGCFFGTWVWAEQGKTINSAQELMDFARQVNMGESFQGQQVSLNADIVLNYRMVDGEGNLNPGNYTAWTPIGTEEHPFAGTFNGNGHTITGLYIENDENNQGLFGVVSGATIYNITVKDSYIKAADQAGAVVAYAKEKSIVSSCHNDNSSILTKNRSGGIVGWTDVSDVYNCSSNGYCSSDRCSGGIVGDVYSNGKIYNCYNGGVVDGKMLVGGISGGTTSADIQNCINVGEIRYDGGYLIAGGAGSRSIENCFSLKNDQVNTTLSIGSSSAAARTFQTAAANLEEGVVYHGNTYTTALSALNAWVAAQESDIYYSQWVQTSMYPYLKDGVISAVKTSYGSETSQWSNADLEEAYQENLVPELLVGEDLTQMVTRGEFAAIAVQLYQVLTGAELTTTGAKPFTDIAGNPAQEAILQASALDIAQGISDTLYEPNAKINRGQLATMLCRTLKKFAFEGWSIETDHDYFLDTSGVPVFDDDALISDWAKPSVYYMAKLGVVKGVDESNFAPRNTTTEQEAADYAMATREQAIVMALRINKISDMYR